jgi:biotin transport system substrate-specific component
MCELKGWLKILVKSLLGTVFIFIFAQIAIPLGSVPMTFQDLSILIIALLSHPLITILSIVFYILGISFGLPLAQGLLGGMSHMLGTTGGYILGFLPMGYIVSKFKSNSMPLTNSFAMCLLGQFFLYVFGISWLMIHLGFEKSIKYGFYPFMYKIPLTILLSIVSTQLIKKRSHYTKQLRMVLDQYYKKTKEVLNEVKNTTSLF